MRLIDADELLVNIPTIENEYKYVRKIINAAPTVELVTHGYWVKTGQSFLFPDRFRNYSCSVCGYDIEKTKYRYCPNCGAYMITEAEK